jgi:biopolymer transport protein ExbD
MASRVSPSKVVSTPEINVTPLVDVCLVLLIIFMVIAPALSEGAMLELPKSVTADPKPKESNPIELALGTDGSVVLDKQKIDRASLKSRIQGMHEADPKRSLLLKMDHNSPYKNVRDVFAEVQDVGFKGILLKVSDKKE